MYFYSHCLAPVPFTKTVTYSNFNSRPTEPDGFWLTRASFLDGVCSSDLSSSSSSANTSSDEISWNVNVTLSVYSIPMCTHNDKGTTHVLLPGPHHKANNYTKFGWGKWHSFRSGYILCGQFSHTNTQRLHAKHVDIIMILFHNVFNL